LTIQISLRCICLVVVIRYWTLILLIRQIPRFARHMTFTHSAHQSHRSSTAHP
jgi:hypothetical protein